MKPYFSIFLIFFLLLLALNQAAEASRLQQHYWKHVMGDDPMPEAIQGLLPSTREGGDPVGGGFSATPVGEERTWEDLINRDFDTRSAAIIYHHGMMNGHDHHHDHGHDGDHDHHVDRPRGEAS